MNKHCCEEMEAHLEASELALKYNPKFREYGILYLDGGTSVQLIEYCPWCGSKLPSSMRDAWFSEIQRIGLEPGDEEVPAEFLSDKWWLTK